MRRLAVCALVVGCSSDPGIPDASNNPPPPAWWQPKVGEVENWDLQVAAPYNLSAQRTMYLLDLFALVSNPILMDYASGPPTLVPTGALAGKLETLHAQTPRPFVICAVDTGVLDLSSPDAPRFPGYATNPPDDPDPPAMGSVIGWSFNTDTAVRFLDISAANRDAFAALLWKRFDLAKQIGCDGIAPRHNDVGFMTSGFTVSLDDNTSWYREVAQQAHQRRLSVGMTDGEMLIDTLQPDFDWLWIDGCGANDDCKDFAEPFLTPQKAVLAVDVVPNDNGVDAATICANQIRAGVLDGLVKSPALDGTMHRGCGSVAP
jgi:hypothetical protein